ncbi:bis(5'-nucleosyl)-tetraphosphatase (symmetrical) YqeK [Beduini massiliensis]|uniref:bis(5'-nucleosyl)-tetraphosphatase (symmetrical) YqeK n=1 Tax=Beduini massiliensis TaxID=1585974 RepID=UPI000942AD9A|nr:bis(5'-nucleosyl)-tetraphosphatase (symmetrical) YqeK [Beduini massiliensis]
MYIDLTHYSYLTLLSKRIDLREDCKNLLCLNDKEKTWQHVQQVAKAAQDLAIAYSVDSKSAYICGLLHDISAVIKPEDMKALMKHLQQDLDPAEDTYPFLLHQKISALIAKDYFHINDPMILSAIACHTTLHKQPSPLDMILFLADKIAWDQTGQPPYLKELTAALSHSLEDACLTYINYLFKEGNLLYPHHLLIEAHQYLKGIQS